MTQKDYEHPLGCEGNRLVVQRLVTLSKQHYILSSLAQLLVRRRWAPLDALKSVII